SRGYGVLWDNCSYTRWGDLRAWTPIPAAQWLDAQGRPGGLTGSYYAGRNFGNAASVRRDAGIDFKLPSGNQGDNTGINPVLPRGEASIRWEGQLSVPQTGDYQLLANYDGEFKLWIDGRLLIDHWRQGWLAAEDRIKVALEAGKPHRVRAEWVRDSDSTTCQLRWKTPAPDSATSLWSEVGDGVDYYFVYGPSLDAVVGGYRRVTGQAAMLPQWAFGLWQSRERYKTAQESLEVVDEFRRRGIPFDNIVQDWQYWKTDQWGSHEFDPSRFPDPAGWVRAIHDRHAHVMISVWGKFYAGTAHFEALRRADFLFPMNLKDGDKDWLGYRYGFLDAFNPAARRLFWQQIRETVFTSGVDAWWMDASEPDLTAYPELDNQRAHVNPNYLGTGARTLLGYPLLIAGAVYDGQREAAPGRRVFNLTRSGYLGLQRYGAASWSGDITSTWTAMRKQIAAGLGYSISGLPYWTMDIGGFAVPYRFLPENATPARIDEWRELNARWFQFGAFVPLLRVHGQLPYREMWQFGDRGSPAYDAMLAADRLRYRLLPYIYSLAGAVRLDGGVLMRPLAMDFPGDARARSLADEYLFGPAILVNPVTVYRARSRSVYLPPASGGWYDFYSGAPAGSGAMIEAEAPYAHLPLFVRAGSIVPVGPELQYVGEKPADPITLFVYAGSDGHFSVYEDDGLSYGYEQGAYSRIPISWSEADRTLTIGGRQGGFPGMLQRRSFQLVLVRPGHAASPAADAKPDAATAYDGSPVTIAF
ncbi:MAG TPA: TIM-barrel domain-containing protein, partial [Opitutaceae bacterium]|nr:TIM-barrel domain-containing protein [Opitutaceae bacterium]